MMMIKYILMCVVLMCTLQAHALEGGLQDTTRRCPRRIPNDAENICNDPIINDLSQGSDATWNSQPIDDNFVHNFLSISRNLNHTLANELRRFELDHLQCDKTKRSLQQLSVSDLVRIRFCVPHTAQNHFTRQYADMAETTQLLGLVSTLEAENCCLSARHLHLTVRNQLLSHWYIIYRNLGHRLSGRRCHVKVDPVSNNALRCEDIRDLVYVILRHTARKLSSSITFLRSMVQHGYN